MKISAQTLQKAWELNSKQDIKLTRQQVGIVSELLDSDMSVIWVPSCWEESIKSVIKKVELARVDERNNYAWEVEMGGCELLVSPALGKLLSQ